MAAYQRGDYATDIRELRLLAEQGYAEAQYGLGVMYDNGQGVPQNYAKAVKWSRKAAEQGYARAQFALGTMYYNGQGVTQDYAETVRWYHKAAEKGYARAQFALGTMYGLGQGVPRDYLQAHVWINIAVSNLPPGEVRDKAVESRDDVVAKRMTPAQISEAQAMAREWKPKK